VFLSFPGKDELIGGALYRTKSSNDVSYLSFMCYGLHYLLAVKKERKKEGR